jgi:hypothetical protein
MGGGVGGGGAVTPTPSPEWANELKYLAFIKLNSFLSEIKFKIDIF